MSADAWQTIAVPLDGRIDFRRRTVLLAGLTSLVSLAGCQTSPETEGSSANLEALRPVWKTARQLAASYQSASESGEQAALFEMLRDNHREHATTLAKILNESGKDSEALGALDAKALGAAEQEASEEARKLCVKAQPDHAVLLGEIAACRSAHVTAIKES